MTTSTRHATDFRTLSGMINDASGDWVSPDVVQRHYQTGEPIEYFDPDGKLAKTVVIQDTPQGTTVGEHSLDNTSMRYQALTTAHADFFVAKTAKRKG